MYSKTFIGNLVEALPYIMQFREKTFVIKFGGSIINSEKEKKAFIDDVALMLQMGMKIVLVHGGGKDISNRLDRMGIETEFVEGYRVTCDEAIKEVEMVLSGSINKDLTLRFNNRGIKAVGMNGKDGGLIKAKKKYIIKKKQETDIGNVGDIEKIDPSYLKLLIDHQYLPIISPIGFDEQGNTYNINADDVAAKICSELNAEKLILMTDVNGLYKEFGDESTFISKLTVETAKKYIEDGTIQGGMIPKIQSCITSIENGTGTTHIINGMIEHGLLLEIFSDDGIGTMVI